jgi:hypothetical protein
VTTDRDHLDVETVAAWIDGGLHGASLAAAEAHASNCERCQALLATVVKTDPMAPRHEAFGTRHQAPGAVRIWRWWLAPLAATAAAVTVWMVVPQDIMQRQTTVAPDAEMTAPAAPAAGVRARDDAAPPAAQPTAPPEEQAGRRSPAGADRFVGAKRNADAAARQTEKPQVARNKIGAAAGNLSEAAASKDRRENKDEKSLARLEAAEPARAPAAPPPAAGVAEPAARADAARGQARIADAITQPAKQTTPLQIVSPDPRFRWRVTADGIELTVDGGRTWLPVRLAQGEFLTAGASPAPLVCWMVGRRGVVLVATDGTNFTRIPFPERVDLVAVASTELRIATITSADGRVFYTENAGRTWNRK